jgi:hypothetical protein
MIVDKQLYRKRCYEDVKYSGPINVQMNGPIAGFMKQRGPYKNYFVPANKLYTRT